MLKDAGANTYCAVVKYRLKDTDAQKRQQLREGLGFVAAELVELGYTMEQIDEALGEARWYAQEEAEGLGRA